MLVLISAYICHLFLLPCLYFLLFRIPCHSQSSFLIHPFSSLPSFVFTYMIDFYHLKERLCHPSRTDMSTNCVILGPRKMMQLHVPYGNLIIYFSLVIVTLFISARFLSWIIRFVLGSTSQVMSISSASFVAKSFSCRC